MSLRRLMVSLAAVLASTVCLTAMTGASASAFVTHNYLFSFESKGGTVGLAVDDSSGEIYVYSGANEGTLYKFNSAGEPADFTATGTNALEGLGHGFGGQLAVDNSSSPAKGDIYLANSTNVLIFSPAGELLGELNENVTSEVPGAPWGQARGVSVDAEGHVYVSLAFNHVSKYTPTSNPVVNTDYASSLETEELYGTIAADGDGNLYAALGFQFIFRFEALQFGPFEAKGTEVTQQGGANNIFPAVDLDTNDLYVDNESEIQIYDPSGNLREEIKPTSAEPSAFRSSNAVAVDSANGTVYAGDGEHGRIVVFGPAVEVPDVTTVAPVMTETTVTAKGAVNPQGSASECFFEYGTDKSYGLTAPCSASPGSGSGSVEVSAEISGLEPGVLYHMRLVAKNANGTHAGEDVAFALPFPPEVRRQWSTDISISTARVNASIAPMSYETTFHVEYGTDTNYGTVVPVPDTDIGSEAGEKSVSQLLTDLLPGTTYHYRVIATNANGNAVGQDETFTTFATPPSDVADSCPNATYRTGPSADLPDCRAYEMVSPVEKNGADVNSQEYKEFAASDSGEHIQFPTRTGLTGTHGSGAGGYSQFVATRGAAGWTTTGVTPTPALNDSLQVVYGATRVLAFSDDFSQAVVRGYDLPGGSGALPNTENLYTENTADASILDTVSRAEGLEETPVDPIKRQLGLQLGGSSADLNVVTFQLNENLVPQATGSAPKVYVSEHGVVKLVGVLPDGSASSGGSALVREQDGAIAHKDTVSQDGSRIFFMSPAEGSERQLYLRKDGSSTVEISESETGEPGPAQNVNFQAATPDGTKVLFSTETRLLSSDPGGPGVALYMYTDGPNPQSEANLTYIGRFSGLEEGRRENVVVKGISDDGSHVYFASEYNEELPFNSTGTGLFLWDSGHIRQVAPVPGAEGFEPTEEARVTPDGRRIAFVNDRRILKQTYASSATAPIEMFTYDEDSDKLTCVSCPPTGAAITSGIEMTVKGTSQSNPGFEVAAKPHFLSSDGRYVFFSTSESLVPQDTNGVADAYEYDTDTGKLSLISPGTGENGTWFVDASADGRDAFVVTREQLSPMDPDKLVDLYDARIDGGLTEPPRAGAPCAGDACQGTPSAAPSFNTASEFSGLGNPAAKPVVNAKPKSLTRAQRLKRALAVCRRKRAKRKRATCERTARKHYVVSKPAKRAARRAGR